MYEKKISLIKISLENLVQISKLPYQKEIKNLNMMILTKNMKL